MNWLNTIGWIVMVFMALVIGAYALGYFVIPDLGDPAEKARYNSIPWSAYLHIIPGGMALILGAFQFHAGLRKRWTSIHRNSGRAYVTFVLIGGFAGFFLAWQAPQSPATQLGFASLAVIWFYSGLMAFYAIRQGNVALHRQWMIRSYALTLAAVTLRLQLPLFIGGMGMTFEEAYAIVAWFSWIPNLIIAEWFINQTPIKRAATQ